MTVDTILAAAPPGLAATPAPSRPMSRLAMPFLLALFVGSGCAALIDEIVWFQLLQFVIGSSAFSLAALLGAFMGGMCLGSLFAPRLLSARRHPLHVYALLELGIGLLALMVPWGMPFAARCYMMFASHGTLDIALRGGLCAACLLAPAALMGATLPVAARFVESTSRGVSWLGLFYGGNTAGAVVGCLAAGFYLLRVYDLATAAYVAVAINLAVALAATLLASRSPYFAVTGVIASAAADSPANGGAAPAAIATPSSGSWAVWLAIGLSGACALSGEVVWTRLLSLLLAGTTYTFSIILAVFLAGIGCGSCVASRITRRPRLALGICQWLLVPAIAWAAWALGEGCFSLPLNPETIENLWVTMARDLARCAWAIFPAACLWGASFPLALAALAPRAVDRGRLVGNVYAVNTIGAIFGAIGCSLFLLPVIGTQQSQRAIICVAALAALGLTLPLAWTRAPLRDGGTRPVRGRVAGMAALCAALLATAWLVERVRPIPFELIAYGRDAYRYMNRGVKELYRGEGLNSTVGVSTGDGIVQFHVSGKVEASTELSDMRIERMLANIPAMLHPEPRSVLVVGCGAGVTAGAFLPYYQSLRRVVICEIEPLVPQRVAPFFTDVNMDVVNDPHVEIVHDDARHYLLATDEKFDIITSDPIHPYVKGAALLYTEEYFELVRRHLRPGGLVTQWAPLYESSAETVKIELATFLKAFPHATFWCNTKLGEGYDLVMLGSEDPRHIDLDALRERMNQHEARGVRRYLAQLGWPSETNLLATYVGQGADLAPWLAGVPVNRDGNLRLQYLAGLIPKHNLMGPISKEMFAHRKFPKDLFIGSKERREELEFYMNLGF